MTEHRVLIDDKNLFVHSRILGEICNRPPSRISLVWIELKATRRPQELWEEELDRAQPMKVRG